MTLDFYKFKITDDNLDEVNKSLTTWTGNDIVLALKQKLQQ